MEFGRTLYRRYLGEPIGEITTGLPSEDLQTSLEKMITKLGVFLIFSFIEASRPFKDKSMNLHDREDLVQYWIQNCSLYVECYMRVRQLNVSCLFTMIGVHYAVILSSL